jgi:NlpC/P60 family putative phage cell wall peptidase
MDEAARIAGAVVREALSWQGTPYRRQASRKGVGCDCLGLVRGVWRAVYGSEPERSGSYAPDWAEAGGGEPLLDGARRHFREKALTEAMPGDVLVFRWRPRFAAKHAGILVSEHSFVHAYEGGGAVTVSALVPQWRRRIAAVFAFPIPEALQSGRSS